MPFKLPLPQFLQLENQEWVLAVLGVLVVARVAIRYGCDPGESKKFLLETADSALIALSLVFFIIRPFIVQAFYIPSGSMKNTLLEDDRILVSKFVYYIREPRRGDIVVFRAPPEAVKNDGEKNKDFIKRLIGLPGDMVEVKGGKLYLNGALQEEPYVRDLPMDYAMKVVDGAIYRKDAGSMEWTQNNMPPQGGQAKDIERAPPGPVPPQMLLVLGDNRKESNDSSRWGFMPRERLLGKALCIFWPLDFRPLTIPSLNRQIPIPVGLGRIGIL